MLTPADGENTEVDSDEHRPDEMSFLDHLEELRWRIVKAVIGIVLGSVLCWVFIEEIVHYVLLRPVQVVNNSLEPGQQAIHLQNLKPFGLLFMYMEVALVGGIILSLPNLLYQVWAFIAPGLLPKERRYIKSIVFFTTFCFLAGISFAYFIMLPSALNFFAGLSTVEIENNIAINEYMSFVVSVVLAAGVIFELPMVSWFLSKLGILTPAFMRHYRKHSIVGILIVAAVLTPGTDPVSQLLLAIPMIILYEISIWISSAAGKKKRTNHVNLIYGLKKESSLKEIAAPIQSHLGPFDAMFDRVIRSKIGLVDLVTKYIIKRKGKRARPILVLLSAELCGGVSERSYRAAALVEILHTATLVHDDVIDEADTRRGFASINAIWRNKISILMGDYLLAKGLLLSLENDDFEFLKITSTAVRRMSEGELHQIQKSRQMTNDETSYLKIIGDKTASLLSTCCEIGAASATKDVSIWRKLRDYGENIGLAFQIRDDVLDFIGKKSITGKPTALDISDKKLTLPIIHALGNASKQEAKAILGMIKSGGKKLKVAEVVQFVESNGGITYAQAKAQGFALAAKSQIDSFPSSSAKDSLMRFADFVVERDR